MDKKDSRKFYFTFGANHIDTRLGSLGNCVLMIEATDVVAARETVVGLRGIKWATSYDTPEAAGVDRFGLRVITVADLGRLAVPVDELPAEMRDSVMLRG